MFSVEQKRGISGAVQDLLRATAHPELPQTGEISFTLHVDGAESWSFADIKNNGAVGDPGVNPHNELMASMPEEEARELIDAAVPSAQDPSFHGATPYMPDPRNTPDDFMREMLNQQIASLNLRVRRLEDRDKIKDKLYAEVNSRLDKFDEFFTPIMQDNLIADLSNKMITMREDSKSVHTRLDSLETAIRQLGSPIVDGGG